MSGACGGRGLGNWGSLGEAINALEEEGLDDGENGAVLVKELKWIGKGYGWEDDEHHGEDEERNLVGDGVLHVIFHGRMHLC